MSLNFNVQDMPQSPAVRRNSRSFSDISKKYYYEEYTKQYYQKIFSDKKLCNSLKNTMKKQSSAEENQ